MKPKKRPEFRRSVFELLEDRRLLAYVNGFNDEWFYWHNYSDDIGLSNSAQINNRIDLDSSGDPLPPEQQIPSMVSFPGRQIRPGAPATVENFEKLNGLLREGAGYPVYVRGQARSYIPMRAEDAEQGCKAPTVKQTWTLQTPRMNFEQELDNSTGIVPYGAGNSFYGNHLIGDTIGFSGEIRELNDGSGDCDFEVADSSGRLDVGLVTPYLTTVNRFLRIASPGELELGYSLGADRVYGYPSAHIDSPIPISLYWYSDPEDHSPHRWDAVVDDRYHLAYSFNSETELGVEHIRTISVATLNDRPDDASALVAIIDPIAQSSLENQDPWDNYGAVLTNIGVEEQVAEGTTYYNASQDYHELVEQLKSNILAERTRNEYLMLGLDALYFGTMPVSGNVNEEEIVYYFSAGILDAPDTDDPVFSIFGVSEEWTEDDPGELIYSIPFTPDGVSSNNNVRLEDYYGDPLDPHELYGVGRRLVIEPDSSLSEDIENKQHRFLYAVVQSGDGNATLSEPQPFRGVFQGAERRRLVARSGPRDATSLDVSGDGDGVALTVGMYYSGGDLMSGSSPAHQLELSKEAGEFDEMLAIGSDLDDWLTVRAPDFTTPITVLAGKGDDVVFGGFGDDLIYGEEGSDVLFGDGFDVPLDEVRHFVLRLKEGYSEPLGTIHVGGNDRILSGPGELEILVGGPGDDRILLDNRSVEDGDGFTGATGTLNCEDSGPAVVYERHESSEGIVIGDFLRDWDTNGETINFRPPGVLSVAGGLQLFSSAGGGKPGDHDGDDEIVVSGGNAQVITGGGENRVSVMGRSAANVFGGSGKDQIDSRSKSLGPQNLFQAWGGDEDDRICGSPQNDIIFGGDGSDTIDGVGTPGLGEIDKANQNVLGDVIFGDDLAWTGGEFVSLAAETFIDNLLRGSLGITFSLLVAEGTGDDTIRTIGSSFIVGGGGNDEIDVDQQFGLAVVLGDSLDINFEQKIDLLGAKPRDEDDTASQASSMLLGKLAMPTTGIPDGYDTITSKAGINIILGGGNPQGTVDDITTEFVAYVDGGPGRDVIDGRNAGVAFLVGGLDKDTIWGPEWTTNLLPPLASVVIGDEFKPFTSFRSLTPRASFNVDSQKSQVGFAIKNDVLPLDQGFDAGDVLESSAAFNVIIGGAGEDEISSDWSFATMALSGSFDFSLGEVQFNYEGLWQSFLDGLLGRDTPDDRSFIDRFAVFPPSIGFVGDEGGPVDISNAALAVIVGDDGSNHITTKSNGIQYINAAGGARDHIEVEDGWMNVIAGGSGDDTIRSSGLTMAWGDNQAFFDPSNPVGGWAALSLQMLDIWRELLPLFSAPTDMIAANNYISNTVQAAYDNLVDGLEPFLGFGSGNDTYFGGSGIDIVFGGPGVDTLHGGGGPDILFGEGGGDHLLGGGGHDLLVGGRGNDTIESGSNPPVFESEDGDIVFGGPGDDYLIGSSGDDIMESEGGKDTFLGLGGNDTIFGGEDVDILIGGTGNNFLFGEAGQDVLLQPGGAGVAVFGSGDAGLEGLISFHAATGVLLIAGEYDSQIAVHAIDGTVRIVIDDETLNPGIAASSVTRIDVLAGSGSPMLDLSAVTYGDFTDLLALRVDSSQGDLTLVGSALEDQVTLGPGSHALMLGEGDETLNFRWHSIRETSTAVGGTSNGDTLQIAGLAEREHLTLGDGFIEDAQRRLEFSQFEALDFRLGIGADQLRIDAGASQLPSVTWSTDQGSDPDTFSWFNLPAREDLTIYAGTDSSAMFAELPSVVYDVTTRVADVTWELADNLAGSANVLLEVTTGGADGDLSTEGDNEVFVYEMKLEVDERLSPPTIASVAPIRWTPEDGEVLRDLVVTDLDTSTVTLVVTAESLNTHVLPEEAIELLGDGENRQLRVIPQAGRFGATAIRLTVTDGTHTTERFIHFEAVSPSVPQVADVANQTFAPGETQRTIPLLLNGAGAAEGADIVLYSSNHAVLPIGGMTLSGSGMERELTITPSDNISGESTITLVIDDGTNRYATDFQVRVTDINDLPTTDLNGAEAGNDAAVTAYLGRTNLLLSLLEPILQDPDDAQLMGMFLKLVDSPEDAIETLGVTPATASIASSYDPGSRTLQLLGLASPAEYAATLQTLSFTTDVKTPGDRTIEVRGFDGQTVGDPAELNVTLVTPVWSWTNPDNVFDVDANGRVQPVDALKVINRLNRVGGGELPDLDEAPPAYYDVNANGSLEPIDALIIINYLNRNPPSGEWAGEAAGQLASEFDHALGACWDWLEEEELHSKRLG